MYPCSVYAKLFENSLVKLLIFTLKSCHASLIKILEGCHAGRRQIPRVEHKQLVCEHKHLVCEPNSLVKFVKDIILRQPRSQLNSNPLYLETGSITNEAIPLYFETASIIYGQVSFINEPPTTVFWASFLHKWTANHCILSQLPTQMNRQPPYFETASFTTEPYNFHHQKRHKGKFNIKWFEKN